MAFPVVEDVTDSDFSSATSHAVPMPATVNAGDLLLIFFGRGWVNTVPSGWTEITKTTGFANTMAVYAKKAAGTEGGTTVTITPGFTYAASASVYRIQAGSWGGDATVGNDVKGASTSTSSSGSPNPPNLAHGLGSLDFLWIACGVSSGATYSGAPTDYTDLVAVAGAYDIGTARRELNAESDNPGTFSMSATASWAAATIAIEPAAAAASYTPRLSLLGVG